MFTASLPWSLIVWTFSLVKESSYYSQPIQYNDAKVVVEVDFTGQEESDESNLAGREVQVLMIILFYFLFFIFLVTVVIWTTSNWILEFPSTEFVGERERLQALHAGRSIRWVEN
ncbi:hypothetical protein HMI54_009832 [Coelomomyces lativittatus]|nr:hypothetical protein HMI55_001539 [Coelomomyces lativittatus]KAJ1516341.1 hypothetical protein HMI54_009832 [Coelomomyces lativittatus]